MKLVKNERFVALIIFGFALIGLVLANSPAAAALNAVKDFEVSVGVISLDLNHWIIDFGLAGFFFLVGLELKREFTSGAFNPFRNVVAPLTAAIFGVAVPAFIFLLITGVDSSYARGWPIPTATDVIFALSVFTFFASRLPKRARSFLLAVVVFDDIIAILVIAVVFPSKGDLGALVWAILPLAIFAFAMRRLSVPDSAFSKLLIGILAGAAAIWFWTLFLESGVHPTVSGVILAFMVPAAFNETLEHKFVLPVNAIVLPVFALFSAAVSLGGQQLGSPLFWAILAGPAAKVIGITFGGWLGYRIAARDSEKLSVANLSRLGALGGIGFTVSLLVANLAFENQDQQNEAILAVLIASLISMVAGAAALATAKRT